MPYDNLLMEEGQPVKPVSAHAQPWTGVTGWMVNASATILRHEPTHERARQLVDQDVSSNRLGGVWIAPDAIR